MDLSRGFQLGDFRIRPKDNVVSGPGGDVRLEPKSMDVLVNLAAAEGETVSRDQLVSAVWPRGFVSDDVLTRCITQIRKAFGDDARSPDYLITIRKRGYKLARPVMVMAASALSDLASAPGVLVLPFENYSKRAEDAYIADGITELITARLATGKGLRVISRTTAMGLKGVAEPMMDIARSTGADFVVEGSVLIHDDRMQVVMQLISAREDAHLLAETYERPLSELLSLQNQIALEIARRVSQALSSDASRIAETASPLEVGPLPPDTLREYLKGRCFESERTADSLYRAAACFGEVIREAPDYAPAYADLAMVRMLLAHYGAEPVESLLPRIHRDLERALALEADNPIALYCRGSTRMFFERDLRGAEQDLMRSITLQPSNGFAFLSMANLCTARGEFEAALGWLQRSLLVNPLDVGFNMNLGDHLILQGDYAGAVKQLRRTLELEAKHSPTRLRLVWALALSGDRVAADVELERCRLEVGQSAAFHEYAGITAGVLGSVEEARSHLEALRDLSAGSYVSPWALARVAAAAERPDEAFEYLEAAVRARSSSLLFFGVTPAFEGLRRLPAGRALLDRLTDTKEGENE